MSTSWIILCPGQGAQAVGMGKGWFDHANPAAQAAAREVFARADKQLGTRLGVTLSELCFAGPAERLNQTDASQPAIYTVSMACWAGWLAMQNVTINDAAHSVKAALGLSLGEYTALALAGAFSFEDGLELVTLRGRAMQDAADSPAEICDKAREQDVLVCANYNAPGQVVLSGHKVACERAAKVAEAMGLRSSMLAVAGAFHSPLMQPAADALAAALAKTPIKSPRNMVIANVTAKPYGDGGAVSDAEIRQRLAQQLTSSVKWSQSCQWLAGNMLKGGAGSGEQGAGGDVYELAPGKTLMGLMRRVDKGVKVNGLEG